MLLDKCPHCDASHVQTNQMFNHPLKDGDPGTWWRILRCQNPNCNRLVLAVTSEAGELRNIYPAGSYELDASIGISQETREDFREAGVCLSAGCYQSSMVMSRRVLQRCLKEQGCNQHALVDAIDHALKQQILRKPFHPIATEIRQYGNLGAHPDDDQLANATFENAHQVLEFARLLIHEFYEIPVAAEKLKHDRKTS